MVTHFLLSRNGFLSRSILSRSGHIFLDTEKSSWGIDINSQPVALSYTKQLSLGHW